MPINDPPTPTPAHHLPLEQTQTLIGASQGKRRRINWSLIKPCSSYRLTDLPDEPLTRILGMLPTKHAAALTLISNKQLMPAFSVLRNFEFDDSPISHCLASPRLVERTPSFKKFVDYVLQASRSDKIDTFTLRFGRFCRDAKRDDSKVNRWKCGSNGECHPTLEPDRLNSWLSFPLARRVRELDLCINVQGECRNLPHSIFVCETLETLKLDSNLDLDIGDDVKSLPIRLPRLKLLHLRTLLFTEDEFVTKLVNSCPVLEDLLLDCWWDCAGVFAISSPSLLKLDLTLCQCDDEKNFTNVIIHTPNVQSFKYCGNVAQHYSISDMNALVQAVITIAPMPEEDEDVTCPSLCNLIKSCSTVSHLYLQGHCVMSLHHFELKNLLPLFHNLNHLELTYTYATFWDKVLVVFLECSPFLHTLVFPYGLALPLEDGNEFQAEGAEMECLFWRTTQASPSCCESHLKKIVINDFRGLQRELDMIQFLLEKALVLESLDISLDTSSIQCLGLHVDPVSVQSALQDMPRASAICSIRVL